MCKRVLSRGSERTLAGRTRGCGGLFQEEIQQVGGPEEKLESDSEGGMRLVWRSCIIEGLIKRSYWRKTKEMIHSFVPFSSASEGFIIKTVIIIILTQTHTVWFTSQHNGYRYLLHLITIHIRRLQSDWRAPTWALDTEPKGFGGLITGWLYIMVGGFIIPIEPICGGCRDQIIDFSKTIIQSLPLQI